ncbi:profilin [Xylaria telfairii]|nr:profilin [Xylaria telfairii]
MSWQQYIDTSLVGSGHIDQAAIVSAAGDSVWAQSTGFNPTPDELKTIVAVLHAAADEKSDQTQVTKVQSEGIYVATDRYVVARIDGRSIYARKGRTGIAIAKTKQAFIVAHHGEAQTAGNATSTTEALADYLIKVGY